MGTTQQTLRIFWRESKRYPKQLYGTLVAWPLGLIAQDLILPLITAQAINKLVEIQGTGVTDYWPIFLPYIIGFIIAGGLGQLSAFWALTLVVRLEVKVRKHMEDRIYDHLLQQSLGFHSNSFSGSLVAMATRFSSSYISIADTLVFQGTTLIVQSVLAIVIIAFFSPLIAGAMLVWTVFYTWLNLHLTKRRIHLSHQAAAADSTITAHLADSMGNISAIKAFASEAREQEAYGTKTLERAIKKRAAWMRAIKNGTATALMMIALQLLILVLSIYAVMNGQIEIGTLLLIQVYMARLMVALWNLSNMTKSLEQSISDAGEMTVVLGQEPEVKDPKQPEQLRVKKGAIAFDNMTFTHADMQAGETLFADFQLRIAPGEKIGLVGHSGSGKTTLTKLLLRFHDIDSGHILIDEQNIAAIRQSDLRQNIAYVPQEPILFHRSLRENIAYSRPSATDKEIEAAAHQAHALEFIKKLPEGLDTVVGERGVKLSGGQRQRIAIARAILKDAPILVLDEATSALDSESERLIQDALGKLMKGRTTIVIAHRLSTIQSLDRIVVLDNGTIIEQGSHTDLLEHNGAYAELWAHQSGGFIEE